MTQFCNLLIHQGLEGKFDKNPLSPLTIPPYPNTLKNPVQSIENRVEKEVEGVDNNERQRVVVVGEEGEREGAFLEEINHPLNAPNETPKRVPSAAHPWRTDDLNIGRNVIPDELTDFDQQIRDFWKVKKGSKSAVAWKQQMTQLIAIHKKHGAKVLGDQLDEAALKGTWQAITLKNYEQWGKGTPRGFTPQEADLKHPAHKVFKADDHYSKPGWHDVPSVTGGKGVLEGMF